MSITRMSCAVLAFALAMGSSNAGANSSRRGQDTKEPAQVAGQTGVSVDPFLTIGESVGDYTPPGIPDGMAAYGRKRSVELLLNHELVAAGGYPYTLANGTQLTGARVTSIELSRWTRKVLDADLAYDTIYNRAGEVVDDPSDLESGGLNRLCSARGVAKGERGFVDDVFFTGEESGNGTEWALDVKRGELWAAPELGRAAWESVAAVETGDPNTIGLLIGDDVSSAPLYYYEGQKSGNDFLGRNGLAEGQLFCWASQTGELSPEDFNGTGGALAGEWRPLEVRDAAMAGQAGFDALGYKDGDTLRSEADALGCFSFSRPEDIHEDPRNPMRAVMASTGRGGTFPSDNWGTLYLVDVETAKLEILLDSDDPQFQDFGVRSADNLTWAGNGKIYVQEDRSTVVSVPKDVAGCEAAGDPADCRDRAFGGRSKIETSLWEIDPDAKLDDVTALRRIGIVDRSAVPTDQIDTDPLDIGDWETSGVIDVTQLFPSFPGQTVLIGNAQAHSLRGGAIDSENLVQGGQLFFLDVFKPRTYWPRW